MSFIWNLISNNSINSETDPTSPREINAQEQTSTHLAPSMDIISMASSPTSCFSTQSSSTITPTNLSTKDISEHENNGIWILDDDNDDNLISDTESSGSKYSFQGTFVCSSGKPSTNLNSSPLKSCCNKFDLLNVTSSVSKINLIDPDQTMFAYLPNETNRNSELSMGSVNSRVPLLYPENPPLPLRTLPINHNTNPVVNQWEYKAEAITRQCEHDPFNNLYNNSPVIERKVRCLDLSGMTYRSRSHSPTREYDYRPPFTSTSYIKSKSYPYVPKDEYDKKCDIEEDFCDKVKDFCRIVKQEFCLTVEFMIDEVLQFFPCCRNRTRTKST